MTRRVDGSFEAFGLTIGEGGRVEQIDGRMCRFHVFVCENTRHSGSFPSCGAQAGGAVLRELRGVARKHRVSRDIWFTSTGCLGWCHEAGVTVVVYPEGDFYHQVKPEDCEPLLQKYIEHLHTGDAHA